MVSAMVSHWHPHTFIHVHKLLPQDLCFIVQMLAINLCMCALFFSQVMDGSLPTSLKHIISNAEYYGPSLFLLGKFTVVLQKST